MGRGSSKAAGGGGAFKLITDDEAVRFEDNDTLDSQVDGVTHYKDWENNLTGIERDAVHDYTGSNYHSLNKAMRSEEGIQSNYHKHLDKEISSAIDKAVLTKPITVYRGSSPDFLGFKSTPPIEQLQGLVGQSFRDKAFTSTSVSKSGTFGDAIAYKILVPPGKGRGAYVRGISDHKSEKEFLLNKNTHFKVVKVG